MNPIRNLALSMNSLSVYRGILSRPVVRDYCRLLNAAHRSREEFAEAWGAFFSALCGQGGNGGLRDCFAREILFDENAFSLAAARGAEVPRMVRDAAARDLDVVFRAASVTPEQLLEDCSFMDDMAQLNLPCWKTGEFPAELGGDAPLEARAARFYRENGCGVYARYRAFIWRCGALHPVLHPDAVSLSGLTGYEMQRREVINNTRAFLRGLPANNCLLYGDRGTGKSSTVKAILNQYYPRGLRMIEMPKESLTDFPVLADRLAQLPMKFIVFIDDLSFSRQDETYASLKAVLEGGLAARPENTLIYATSNRRHLLRESFSDREGDEVHRGDTIQESLSLADRFGLSIRFSLPAKEEYLAIVRRLAEQRGLTEHMRELEQGAERWAIGRGGRSPRCAKQYIRAAEARIRSDRAPG
ncbi:MAG: ATP-binding protein [Oscillospiraceae bacterium]|jgi:predicted AAA+ superfamily ATPase|nr:ATP-binding protein [Oscillospiraceae bacterium]